MNARYYDPATGRFISMDSYRGTGESFWHLYAYCDGDPVNCVDRSGHDAGVKDRLKKSGYKLVRPLSVDYFPLLRQRVDYTLYVDIIKYKGYVDITCVSGIVTAHAIRNQDNSGYANEVKIQWLKISGANIKGFNKNSGEWLLNPGLIYNSFKYEKKIRVKPIPASSKHAVIKVEYGWSYYLSGQTKASNGNVNITKGLKVK